VYHARESGVVQDRLRELNENQVRQTLLDVTREQERLRQEYLEEQEEDNN
jgi:hypothetical protein